MSRKNPRTLAEIKADPRVREIEMEDDGYGDNEAQANRPSYWLVLEPGFELDDCHTLHESTVKDLAFSLSRVIRGECDACKAGKRA